MEEKDPVIKAFCQKMKNPAVLTFLLMITILVILGMIVEYIRPDPIPMMRMI